MKPKYVALIVIFILLFVGSLVYFLRDKEEVKDMNIESISYLRFFYTQGYAIDADVSYEIDCGDKCTATIKPYGKSDEEAIEVTIDEDILNRIMDVLNKYTVVKWDGFNKSDNGVLDGDTFTFNLDYNKDINIYASGYMRWPDNYREVKEELDSIFNSLMEE